VPRFFLFVLLLTAIFVVGIGTMVRLFLNLFKLFWRTGSRPQQTTQAPPSSARPEKKAERMLPCATCGVHVPESEGVKSVGQFFCCEAHRAGRAPDAPRGTAQSDE
jgi:uncharacterized protein